MSDIRCKACVTALGEPHPECPHHKPRPRTSAALEAAVRSACLVLDRYAQRGAHLMGGEVREAIEAALAALDLHEAEEAMKLDDVPPTGGFYDSLRRELAALRALRNEHCQAVDLYASRALAAERELAAAKEEIALMADGVKGLGRFLADREEHTHNVKMESFYVNAENKKLRAEIERLTAALAEKA